MLPSSQSRLLSMRLDVDEHTAVTAVSVLCHMQALDLLDAEESLEVCELVFLENRAISHTAGQFAVDYLFSEDFMSRAKQREVPPGEMKSLILSSLSTFVSLFVNGNTVLQ